MHDKKCRGVFQLARPLILASASPRRQRLLAGLGLLFDVRPSRDGEPAWEKGIEPAKYAAELAKNKGEEAAREYKDAVILSADTIVVLGDDVLGKPSSEREGLEMLTKLKGRWHVVITGLCIQCREIGLVKQKTVETKVFMADYPEEVLSAYVATGEGLDKAGSYAVQGIGSFLVERIEGSYTNVVGLPVTEVVNILLNAGLLKVCNQPD